MISSHTQTQTHDQNRFLSTANFHLQSAAKSLSTNRYHHRRTLFPTLLLFSTRCCLARCWKSLLNFNLGPEHHLDLIHHLTTAVPASQKNYHQTHQPIYSFRYRVTSFPQKVQLSSRLQASSITFSNQLKITCLISGPKLVHLAATTTIHRHPTHFVLACRRQHPVRDRRCKYVKAYQIRPKQLCHLLSNWLITLLKTNSALFYLTTNTQQPLNFSPFFHPHRSRSRSPRGRSPARRSRSRDSHSRDRSDSRDRR